MLSALERVQGESLRKKQKRLRVDRGPPLTGSDREGFASLFLNGSSAGSTLCYAAAQTFVGWVYVLAWRSGRGTGSVQGQRRGRQKKSNKDVEG